MGAVPRERFVPGGSRRQAYADRAALARRRADDLAALDRRRDLPGARSSSRVTECSRSAPAAATRPRFSRGSPPGWSRSSASRSSPSSPGPTSLGAGVERVEVRICADGSARRCPIGRRSTRSRFTPRSPAEPEALLAQLAPGGRLVAPLVAGDGEELLTRFRPLPQPSAERVELLSASRSPPCRFVPLIGAAGYPSGGSRRAERRLREPQRRRIRLGSARRWPALSTSSTSTRRSSPTSSSAVARRRRSGSATRSASTSAVRSSGSRSATATARGRRSSPRSSTTSR